MLDHENKTTDSKPATLKHIALVASNISAFSRELIKRALEHDASKLLPPEKEYLDKVEYLNQTQGVVEYRSKDYLERSKLIRPMILHHVATNRHHPEFHENWIYGMDLMDLVEMISDWNAAAMERNPKPVMEITKACERYNVDPQLTRILQNTATNRGWKWK